MARRPSSVRLSVCKPLRKSLLLADNWPDRHQTCTRWSPGKHSSRMCSRSRSRSKVKIKGHVIRALLCWHKNRFSQTIGRIATKLAHDGQQVSLHPGCSRSQGQGQSSRDSRTFFGFLEWATPSLTVWFNINDCCGGRQLTTFNRQARVFVGAARDKLGKLIRPFHGIIAGLIISVKSKINKSTYISIQCESKKSPVFSDIFSKRLGIFSLNFTRLLCIPIYAGEQIYIQLPVTLTKLCHIKRKRDHHHYARWVVALNTA